MNRRFLFTSSLRTSVKHTTFHQIKSFPLRCRFYSSSTITERSWRKITLLGLSGISLALIYDYSTDTRNSLNKLIVLPLMRKIFNGEEAHNIAIKMGKWGLLPIEKSPPKKDLHTKIWGKVVDNPIGLAAGFDKNGEAIDSLFRSGFGLVEIGSITPKPQEGNDKPRVFRLEEDEGVINRYGFNSDGHEQVLQRLRWRVLHYLLKNNLISSPSFSKIGNIDQVPSFGELLHLLEKKGIPKSLFPNRLLGINLGKNKNSPSDSVEDYTRGIEIFAPYADYLVINISSPNTPGLRLLQKREQLQNLLQEVLLKRNQLEEPYNITPLVVKISPDMSSDELRDVAEVAMNCGVDGIIVSNTTLQRPLDLESNSEIVRESGGLSGKPLFPLALDSLRQLRELTQGKMVLIGCGGIRDGTTAKSFLEAGASIVQLYTALVYDGPGVVTHIKKEMSEI